MSALDNPDMIIADDALPDGGTLLNSFSPATNLDINQDMQYLASSNQEVERGGNKHDNPSEVACSDATTTLSSQQADSTLARQSTAIGFNRSGATRTCPQTVSGATAKGSRFISELCLLIHTRIGSVEIRDRAWLSDVIRRFAVRIGLESSDEANQDIFCFVHKCHLSIATYFELLGAIIRLHEKSMEQYVDVWEDWLSDDRHGSSSFKEKLTSWGIVSRENLPPIPNYSHEDDSPIPELADFNRTIAESNSFMWLIASIRESRSTLMRVTPSRTFREAVFDHLVPAITPYRSQLKSHENVAVMEESASTLDRNIGSILIQKPAPSLDGNIDSVLMQKPATTLERNTDSILMDKPAPTLDGNTDSGYASRHTDARREEPGISVSQSSESVGWYSDMDAQTSYSILTEGHLNSVESHVSNLSDSLFHSIGKYLDANSWPSVLKVLPRLLKAFAMQIGMEASTQENRYIMLFIHQHHKKIVDRIEAIFSESCDLNQPGRIEPRHEIMPLNEKFNRWNVDLGHSPRRMEESLFADPSFAHFFPDEADSGHIGLGEGPRLQNNGEDCPENSNSKGRSTALTFEADKDESQSSEEENQSDESASEEDDTDVQIGQKTYESIVLKSEAYRRLVLELRNLSSLEWGDHSEASYTNDMACDWAGYS
ncbi:hypothetical protein CCHR01_16410 [Colletotrichum chrysophilum]|uniref:Uncharacterized protein n=1 Tax=Colletotrichum chrysophilum TaxID=1836956 RepID=A0AAD9EA16_9PEZI|nr:hypothetical protein CCHR01_16410 [Colletotrichum chrysophilum]